MQVGVPAFRVGHARDGAWRALAAQCLAQIGEGQTRANFGWLYLTDHFADEVAEIREFLSARLGVEHWTGTVGIGVCAADAEYYDCPAMAVMVSQFPRDGFRLFSTARQDLDDFVTAERAWLDNAGALFGMVHADPTDGAMLHGLSGIADYLNAFLVGGLTSSRGRHPQIADGISEGGLSGVLFAESVGITTGLSQGCSPIGPSHDITESQGNVVISLDGRPALDVFREDIGDVLARNLHRVAGYIFAARPITGTDWGDYLVRNLTGVDEGRGVIAVGDDLRDGGQLMFCRRDRATATDDLYRMLADVKARLPGPPRGAVYHTCLARGPNMFESPDNELAIVRRALGDIPLVGLFGNGEISNGRLYTYTGVITVFS